MRCNCRCNSWTNMTRTAAYSEYESEVQEERERRPNSGMGSAKVSENCWPILIIGYINGHFFSAPRRYSCLWVVRNEIDRMIEEENLSPPLSTEVRKCPSMYHFLTHTPSLDMEPSIWFPFSRNPTSRLLLVNRNVVDHQWERESSSLTLLNVQMEDWNCPCWMRRRRHDLPKWAQYITLISSFITLLRCFV